MIALLLTIGFRSIYPLFIKLGVQNGNYVFIQVGAAISWIMCLFPIAFWKAQHHPFDVKWPWGYVAMFFIGVIAAGMSLTYYKAVELLPVSLVTLATTSAPAITLLFAYIFLDERLSTRQWLGVPLIFIGLWLLIDFEGE